MFLNSDLDQFQLGTLSHMINVKTTGYQELPDWPEVPPDPSVRDVEVQMTWTASSAGKSKLAKKKAEKEKSFYSEDESSSSEGMLSFTSGCILLTSGALLRNCW